MCPGPPQLLGYLEKDFLLWAKNLNIIYHHFQEHVRKGKMHIYPFSTKDQLADILIKPLPQNDFLHLRKKILQF
jgi:hypothetical protein